MFFHNITCALITFAQTPPQPFLCRSLRPPAPAPGSPSLCSHQWAWTWQLCLGSLMLLLDHSLLFLSKISCFDSLIMDAHTHHTLLAAAVFRPLAGLSPSWHTSHCPTLFLSCFLGFLEFTEMARRPLPHHLSISQTQRQTQPVMSLSTQPGVLNYSLPSLICHSCWQPLPGSPARRNTQLTCRPHYSDHDPGAGPVTLQRIQQSCPLCPFSSLPKPPTRLFLISSQRTLCLLH